MNRKRNYFNSLGTTPISNEIFMALACLPCEGFGEDKYRWKWDERRGVPTNLISVQGIQINRRSMASACILCGGTGRAPIPIVEFIL